MIDDIAKRGKQMNFPFNLHNQILEQFHSGHTDIKKTRLTVRESVYWATMNTDIKNTRRHCLEYQQMHP